MDKREFITSTVTAMVIPSFVSISFDPEDEIIDNKWTTMPYDERRHQLDTLDNEAMED